MFTAGQLVAITLTYLAVLFAVALAGDRLKKFHASPLVYSLSLAVYCTSWTFYGSVGVAANSGYLFLTIYLGPTLAWLFGGAILRRIIERKNRYKITSIADFISARYKRSQGIAALVTLICLVGTVPYIALQLKAILSTFFLAAGAGMESRDGLEHWLGMLFVGILSFFTILFGVRKLDPTERHPGMMVALVAECVFKLVALTAVGVFIVYGLFDGLDDLFKRASDSAFAERIAHLERPPSAVTWFSYTLLSMSAIFFLPRQFHVTVVENSSPGQVRQAQWLFPVYLIAINFFVIPIAVGGLLLNYPASSGDSFVLRMPLDAGSTWLSALVYLGGFAAASGMIMITSMTVSVMVTNHLVLPFLERFPRLHSLRRHLLHARWVVVVLFLLGGYAFQVVVGKAFTLVNLGIISFVAVLQFAPIVVGGLFWRKGTLAGASAGLCAGLLAWFYTLIVPAFVKGGVLGTALLDEGPWGIALLRPEALLGLSAIDSVSHAVFWTMLLNIACYVAFSLVSKPDAEETEMIDEFFEAAEEESQAIETLGDTVDWRDKRERVRQLFLAYLPVDKANEQAEACFAPVANEDRRMIDLVTLSGIRHQVERILSGAIGSAAAHHSLQRSGLFDAEEEEQLRDIYATLLSQMHISPQELREKISYYQERERLINEHAQKEIAQSKELLRVNQELMQSRIDQMEADRKADLARVQAEAKSQFLATMSHEIRTPMNGVMGMSEMLLDTDLDKEQRNYVETIFNSAQALLAVINDILDYSKLEANKLTIESIAYDLEALITECCDIFAYRCRDSGIPLYSIIEADTPTALRGDPYRVRQIIVNMVGNAIKFTPEGYVALRVRADSSHLRFEIEDTGIGMTEEQMAEIFSPFAQAEASIARQFGGTGLGLTISKRLAELMGGEVGVENRTDRGARFWFSVALETEGDRLSRYQFGGKRALIVDPDASFCGHINELFIGWGIDSHAVSEAAALVESGQGNDTRVDFALVNRQIFEQLDPGARPACEVILLEDDSGPQSPATDRLRTLAKPLSRRLLKEAISEFAGELVTAPAPKRVYSDHSAVKVLVADDNEVNRRVIQGLLKKFSIEPDMAENGQEAVDRVADGDKAYDLVLMDCEMPVMDGFEATRRIKTAVSTPPLVVALSAHALVEYREMATQAGMDDYLTKPVRLNELRALLESRFTNIDPPASPMTSA